jgi:hypothetical protein
MSRSVRRSKLCPGSFAAILVGLFVLPGCGPSTELTLHQPFAPPAQQNLKLTCERAYHATTAEMQTSMLAFPLPGAVDGPRTFVLYISAPNRAGQIHVAPHDPQGARGFLIQELGALAGRSDFSVGTLRYHKVLFAPRLRRLELDIRTEDGAEITGRATLEEFPRAVETFEREFAADIASLPNPTSQPTEGDQTSAASEPPEEEK